MWKAALAGAMVFAAVGSTSLSAEPFASAGAAVAITHSQIGQLKNLLRLTAEQERHWPAVEAALHALIKADEVSVSVGLVQNIRARASAFASNAAAIGRVIAAARPLLKSLDESQRRDVSMLARSLGITKLAAAL